MLKKRIISLLTLQDGVLFRTKKFVPDYRYTLNFVDLDLVDEVVLIDVGGDREAFYKTVREFTDKCQVPTSVGGKIKDIEEVNRLFGELPVEKVVVERGLRENPHLGERIADRWGRQALCQGITLGQEPPAGLRRLHPNPDPPRGEILLQSAGRDGSLMGYDLKMVRLAAKLFSVPIIAGSGCGTWAHMKEAFEAGADACATSCIHHFPASQIRAAKEYLSGNGIPVRPV